MRDRCRRQLLRYSSAIEMDLDVLALDLDVRDRSGGRLLDADALVRDRFLNPLHIPPAIDEELDAALRGRERHPRSHLAVEEQLPEPGLALAGEFALQGLRGRRLRNRRRSALARMIRRRCSHRWGMGGEEYGDCWEKRR